MAVSCCTTQAVCACYVGVVGSGGAQPDHRLAECKWTSEQRTAPHSVGTLAGSDPWLCAELLRGGILGLLVRVLHRMAAPDKAVTAADDTLGAGIPSYELAVHYLLPSFASVPEVRASFFAIDTLGAGIPSYDLAVTYLLPRCTSVPGVRASSLPWTLSALASQAMSLPSTTCCRALQAFLRCRPVLCPWTTAHWGSPLCSGSNTRAMPLNARPRSQAST